MSTSPNASMEPRSPQATSSASLRSLQYFCFVKNRFFLFINSLYKFMYLRGLVIKLNSLLSFIFTFQRASIFRLNGCFRRCRPFEVLDSVFWTTLVLLSRPCWSPCSCSRKLSGFCPLAAEKTAAPSNIWTSIRTWDSSQLPICCARNQLEKVNLKFFKCFVQ